MSVNAFVSHNRIPLTHVSMMNDFGTVLGHFKRFSEAKLHLPLFKQASPKMRAYLLV